MNETSSDKTIPWRDWSKEAFDESRSTGRLILLDLSAAWCHWCHVMDETTYSDPEVIRTIKERFIPVRVDIDKRPDITERYNKGGFPTTAFLSDRAETIWGGTYVPPDDMKEIIKAVLSSQESGELAGALERERQPFLDISKASEKEGSVDSKLIDGVFEDIFSSFDPEWGGFGIEPKFPHPDAIDILLYRFAGSQEPELKDAVKSTLDHMIQGLYDTAEGGLFRYSVTRDWKEPHYEKMLETNLGFLRNLAHAAIILDDDSYVDTARGIGEYLLKNLRDPNGGFYSSQDADEEYYKLSKAARTERKPPKVIKDIFSGWNLQASNAFIEAGALLGDEGWIDAGRAAWEYSSSIHWNHDKGLVRHEEGGELYLFEDQLAHLEALISMAEVSRRKDIEPLIVRGREALAATDKAFRQPDGSYGDIIPETDAIGQLSELKSPISPNARWARARALFGALSFEPEITMGSWDTLKSYGPKQVRASGVFAATYILAWWGLERGPRLVEIHGVEVPGISVPLWFQAMKALDPAAVVTVARPTALEIGASKKTFAVVCTPKGCSQEIEDPMVLASMLRPGAQVKSK